MFYSYECFCNPNKVGSVFITINSWVMEMSSNRNGKRFIITNRSHSLKRKLFLFSSASLENWLQTGNGYCMTHLRRIATV